MNIKNKTRSFLFTLSILSSVNAFANIDKSHMISCLIDKSNSLDVSFQTVEGDVRSVELTTKNFLGEHVQHLATLSKPMLQITQYGDVTMVSENFGRSGYIFLRFEQKSATRYDGFVDINYFQNHSYSTSGTLVPIPCFSYER